MYQEATPPEVKLCLAIAYKWTHYYASWVMLHILSYPSTTNDFLIEKYDQWHSILVSLLFSTCMVHICVLPPSVSKASYVHHLFFQDLQCGADVSCHCHCIDQPIYSTVVMKNRKRNLFLMAWYNRLTFDSGEETELGGQKMYQLKRIWRETKYSHVSEC